MPVEVGIPANLDPAFSTAREFVEDVGVLSYGSNEADTFRGAAVYLAKILSAQSRAISAGASSSF